MKKYSLYLILFFSCFLFSNLKTIAGGVSATITAHFYPGGFNITCNGLNDGGFDISIAGGGPFDVDITKNGSAFYTNHNTSLTFISLASLGAGEYIVTVYDQFDQSQVIPSITLIEPHPLSVSADPVLLPPCNYMISTVGGSDGKIFANANGGTPGYSYVWSTGHTTISIGSLPAGTYSVTVTDGNYCTSSSSATLVDPPALSVSLSSPVHGGYQISCYNGRDGEIIAVAIGGCPPYEYDWGGGFTLNDHPTGLSVGTHTVIVRDAQGAITGGAIDLYQASKIIADITPFAFFNGFNVSCYQCFDGSITISNVSGGVGGYTYNWDPYGQISQNISNLDAKSYNLTITDANGCLYTSGDITLTQPNRDDWTINGNDNIDDQSNYLGTIGASDLVIKTNSLERMRVDEDGNVGIGTSQSPSEKLDVDGGNILIRGANHFANISDEANLFLGNTSFFIKSIKGSGSGGTSGIQIGANPLPDQSLFIEESSGSVQIGNSLTVKGNDLDLGTTIGGSRKIALVNDQANDRLVINYGGHFSNGVFIAGSTLKVASLASNGVDNVLIQADADGVLSSLPASGIGLGLWNASVDGNDIFNMNLGNVGIGTIQTPEEKLDVDGGNILVRGSNHFANISDEANLFLGNTSFFIKSIKGSGAGGQSGIQIGANPGTDRSLFIEENSGNVQIGNSLTVKGNDLDLGTTIAGSRKIALVNDQTNDRLVVNYGGHFANGVFVAGSSLRVASLAANGTGIVSVDNNGTCTRLGIPNDATKVLLGDGSWGNVPTTATSGWQMSGSNMYTLVNGSVAIGTNDFSSNTSPNWPSQYKLAVNGHIICTEARVKGNSVWPDFVFEKNYVPIPLDELALFLEENKHLPGIPTKQEVKDDGFDLGDMDAKLLQKIEELTLYVLDLKKENDILKEQVKSIKKEMNGKR